jgi:Putative DnaT-like ssDNA binding protein
VPVTLDATVGGAAANTFATDAEADAYIGNRLNSGAWSAASGDDQARALIEATRELSTMIWQGSRATDTQALSWPRFLAPNPDGVTITWWAYYDPGVIPQRIKDATCELALEFLRAGSSDIASTDTNSGVIEKTVDVLTTRWQPGQRPLGLNRFPRVLKLISPLLSIGTGQVRLTR